MKSYYIVSGILALLSFLEGCSQKRLLKLFWFAFLTAACIYTFPSLTTTTNHNFYVAMVGIYYFLEVIDSWQKEHSIEVVGILLFIWSLFLINY